MISIQLLSLLYLICDWNLSQASHIPPKAMRLFPRRFNQQNVINPQIADCPGEICGNLFGKIPGSLLAGADPCAAQDLADEIITTAKTNDKIKKDARDQMIQVAKTLAGAEHNTPPDSSKNPPTPRQALYCLKEPKNEEIKGIVMKQDPATAGGKEFFDPKTKKTVLLGEDPRTFPRGAKENPKGTDTKTTEDKTGDPDKKTGEEKPGKETPATREDLSLGISTGNEGDPTTKNKKEGDGNGAGGGDGGETGKRSTDGFKGIFIDPASLKACNNPQIKFGGGFNGRKKDEFTFVPVDQTHYAHGEALDLSIITRSTCDKMLNCGLDEKEKIFNKCKSLVDAVGKSKRDGSGADNWNLAFGFVTNFKALNPQK